MRIRPATVADAAGAARLINDAYEVERFFVAGDRTSPAALVDLMEAGTLLVAEEDGDNIFGCIYLEIRGEAGYFGLLAVAPDRQGRFVGRQLVHAAEALARQAGATVMEIHVVNLRRDLFPYYNRLGYQETGVVEPYVDRPVIQPCHFVVLRKRLEPGVLP